MSSSNEVPEREELAQRICAVKDGRERAFLAATYLTAGRINEVVQCRSRLKQHTVMNGEGELELEEFYDYTRTPGIRPNDIEWKVHDGKEVMVITLLNQKNRVHRTKELPIMVALERQLVEAVRVIADAQKDKDAPMFPFSYVTGWKIARRCLDMHPHFLRHCRLTHLSNPPYRYDHVRLMKFAGWTSTQQADRYIHTRWSDFV